MSSTFTNVTLPQWLRLIIFFLTLPAFMAFVGVVAAEAVIDGFVMAVLQIMMPAVEMPTYGPTPLQQKLNEYCSFLS